MDRKPRNFQPQAAELESKVMLSVAAATPPVDAEVTTLAAEAGSTPAPAEGVLYTTLSTRSGATTATAITDVVPGKYHAAQDNRAADAPYHVQFQGAGKVDTLGRAKLAGQLDLGGYRVAGTPQVTGTLTLSNARGSVKLALTGGSDGFGDVPNGKFVTTATVVKATGAYRGFQRAGTVTVDFGADQLPATNAVGGPATVTLALKPLVK